MLRIRLKDFEREKALNEKSLEPPDSDYSFSGWLNRKGLALIKSETNPHPRKQVWFPIGRYRDKWVLKGGLMMKENFPGSVTVYRKDIEVVGDDKQLELSF